MMKSRKKQRGQAFIESALIMLIFVPVLVGIADFGQVIYFHASLTERARAAARYGAVHTYTDGSAIKNVAVYNDASPATGTAGLVPYLTTSLVTATLDDAGTVAAGMYSVNLVATAGNVSRALPFSVEVVPDVAVSLFPSAMWD